MGEQNSIRASRSIRDEDQWVGMWGSHSQNGMSCPTYGTGDVQVHGVNKKRHHSKCSCLSLPQNRGHISLSYKTMLSWEVNEIWSGVHDSNTRANSLSSCPIKWVSWELAGKVTPAQKSPKGNTDLATFHRHLWQKLPQRGVLTSLTHIIKESALCCKQCYLKALSAKAGRGTEVIMGRKHSISTVISWEVRLAQKSETSE